MRRHVGAEGTGFAGEANLLATPQPLARWHIFALVVGVGPGLSLQSIPGNIGANHWQYLPLQVFAQPDPQRPWLYVNGNPNQGFVDPSFLTVNLNGLFDSGGSPIPSLQIQVDVFQGPNQHTVFGNAYYGQDGKVVFPPINLGSLLAQPYVLRIGVPVATHEIFPAALVGVDNTEHTAATSRRGYSPKMSTLQRSYDDVIQLFGKSGRIFCPMISGAGVRRLFEREPALKSDPRFALYPAWIQQQVAAQPNQGNAPGGDPAGGSGKMVMDVMRAGGLVVAGTDTPNGINLHGEIMAYTMAGMRPYEALKAATVNPAQALGLDAGTIESG